MAGLAGAGAALLLATLVAGRRGARAVVGGWVSGALVLVLARRRIGGFTGDVLGRGRRRLRDSRPRHGGNRMTSWARPVPLVGDTTSAAERADDPRAWRFDEEQRRAVYDVIAARRDIRRFRPDQLEPDLVHRLLAAAHAGPSVGHCQPWRFLLVTDAPARERAALIAERERQRQASLLTEDARRRMLDLQLDGIAEAPLGIVVCCDRRAAPAGVLGRATFPDTDMWSCACAIENLWLAARAEGLGVGWVTLFPPDELAGLVGLPPGVETLGWLCVGWPDERPPSPGLERAGWSRRAPLEAVVLHERWDGLAQPPLPRPCEPPTSWPSSRPTTRPTGSSRRPARSASSTRRSTVWSLSGLEPSKRPAWCWSPLTTR